MTAKIAQYQSFNQDGLELVINVETGEAFASQSATSRMLEIPRTTFISGTCCREYTTVSAEIVTGGQSRGVELVSAQDIFKLALKYNTDLAYKMGSAGATVYLYGLAGYEIKPTVLVQPEQPKLKPYEENVKVAHSIRDITDTLFDNPRLAQFLIDQTIDQCFSKTLPSAEVPIKGAAEIAEALGLPVTIKNRSALGKFLSKQGHETLKEDRLCNGQMRQINCYRVTPDVEQSVRNFFN